MCDCKLYPVVKAFDVAKAILAVVLAILGAVLIWFEPHVVNCDKFMSECPRKFVAMQNKVSHISYPRTAEINTYCSCMDRCMNYFDIYKDFEHSLDETNCYQKAWDAGALQASVRRLSVMVQPVIDMQHWKPISRRLMRFMPEDEGLAGAAKSTECSSCDDIKDQLKQTFIFLGGVAIGCALILGVSATCEIKGLRMQSACFHIFTMLLDLVAFGILVTAFVIAFLACLMSMMACKPDKWMSDLEISSQVQSGGNNEQSAAFLDFFVSVLEPLFSDMCMQKSKFTIYWMAAAVSAFCTFMGLLMICIIGCGCTSDGEDEDGEDAQHVDNLQKWMPHRMITGAVSNDREYGYSQGALVDNGYE